MQFAYTRNVFINCPFDEAYQPIFQAIIFTVFDCGYTPRCSLEIEDSSEVRIDKIVKVISECKFGIHDISRTELDEDTNLPRFNMPLELGMFLGEKRFGDDKQGEKACLILDKAPYRYQSFISDIAGQDIQSHKNDDSEAIKVVRNWLRNVSGRVTIPGGKEILRRYRLFKMELSTLCEKMKLAVDEMTFNDYTHIVYQWLKRNP
jgi:predicted nucleotide-binding protein